MTETGVGAAVQRPGPADAPPLRIVLVEFLPSGGMYQFSFQFAEALAAAGHTVELLTGPDPELASSVPGLTVVEALPTWHPNERDEHRPLVRRLRRAWRALLLAESWRRVLVRARRDRPDVVQLGELRYALDSVALLTTARLAPGPAYVDVAHNPVPYDVTSTKEVEKSGRLTRGLLARAYAACDLVLVLGEGPRRDLLAHFPRVRRTAVCGHGSYGSVVPGSDAAVTPASATGPQALFFGAWTRYKNIPLMLEAFALVREQLPGARLTVAGPVMPDVDLAAVTAQADLVGNVDLRPGYVDLADLAALFGSHRVVVYTYETVNISGSIHMAYTFGRPVVATDVGAMSDVVEDGVTGLLAAPDPAAVAAALLQLLTDPAAAGRMGAAASRRAEQEASWTDVADRAVTAYRSARPGAEAVRGAG
jgi:glycosyltransferase involved in cell wall biosynthesis